MRFHVCLTFLSILTLNLSYCTIAKYPLQLLQAPESISLETAGVKISARDRSFELESGRTQSVPFFSRCVAADNAPAMQFNQPAARSRAYQLALQLGARQVTVETENEKFYGVLLICASYRTNIEIKPGQTAIHVLLDSLSEARNGKIGLNYQNYSFMLPFPKSTNPVATDNSINELNFLEKPGVEIFTISTLQWALWISNKPFERAEGVIAPLSEWELINLKRRSSLFSMSGYPLAVMGGLSLVGGLGVGIGLGAINNSYWGWAIAAPLIGVGAVYLGMGILYLNSARQRRKTGARN